MKATSQKAKAHSTSMRPLIPGISKSAQMRLQRAAGMSVGDIARLFNTTYHNAYSAVVVRAGNVARLQPSAKAKHLGELQTNELADVPFATLLAAATNRGTTKDSKANWRAARDELDRRDPTGAWLNKRP